jgi:hypothetical protein
MRKRGSVITFGDDVIVEDGGSPEFEVAAWWDALDSEKQALIAHLCGADYEQIGKWEDMMPIGQQMRIHMWYDQERGSLQ